MTPSNFTEGLTACLAEEGPADSNEQAAETYSDIARDTSLDAAERLSAAGP